MDTDLFLQIVQGTPTPVGTAAMWWMGQMGLWVKLGETVLRLFRQ